MMYMGQLVGGGLTLAAMLLPLLLVVWTGCVFCYGIVILVGWLVGHPPKHQSIGLVVLLSWVQLCELTLVLSLANILFTLIVCQYDATC